MAARAGLDLEAIRTASKQFGVQRLRLFGSALTDRFDPVRSDLDFLVSFEPRRQNVLRDFLDLKFELERITGRRVDLVMERSVRNPFFRQSAFASAEDVYAA